jgi:hypothetical protein
MVSGSANTLTSLYGTERNGTRSAQGFKGSKNQKMTKNQQRMEAMRNNKSPGVRGYSIDDELSLMATILAQAFVQLPTSQLKHELFQSQRLDELTLPQFSAVRELAL